MYESTPVCYSGSETNLLLTRKQSKIHYYNNLKQSLLRCFSLSQVEVVLATSKSGDADERLDRVSSEPIYCADAGFSFMMRKDEVDNMRWLETGLQKLRDNGDYAWLCNLGKSR